MPPVYHRCMICRTVQVPGAATRVSESEVLALFERREARPSDGLCGDECKAEYKRRFCGPLEIDRAYLEARRLEESADREVLVYAVTK